MRYIKSFESISNEEIAETAKLDLEDALVYVKDYDYKVEVKIIMDYVPLIFIGITDYYSKRLFYKDIKDEIDRALSIVSDRFIPTIVYFKEVQEDGRIFNRVEREVLPFYEFEEHILKTNKELAYLSIGLEYYF